MADKIKYKINNAEYEAKFTLSTAPTSPDGGGDGGGGGGEGQGGAEINFSKSAIRGMDLEENFLEPFTNGNIYINNPLDFIEDGKLVRGDGRDKFTILLEPVDGGSGAEEEKLPLEYNFVISGELNSTGKTDRLNNFKTYRLLDRSYFLLSEQIPYGKRFRGKVGCIIKDILEQFGIPCDPGEWENGDMEIDVLPEHILPPSTFRYSDLIRYLIKLNYVKRGGTYVRIFLNWCRRCKYYKYKALSDIFMDNVKLTREGFMVDDLVTKCGVNKNNPNTGPGYTLTNVNNAALANTDFSTPMLVYTNSYLNNLLVSNYDPILGEHIMNIIRIADVKEYWTELFVQPFGYIGGKAQPWVVLNEVKTMKIFRNLGFPFPADRMRQLAEAELTTNMTFFNLQLGFQTLGNTDRQPGEFMDVSVAREDKEKEGVNPFSGDEIKHRSDAKLLGKWFITKIRHEFTTAKVDNYTNLIQCIKPHIGPGEPTPSDSLL
tara:strand:- start:118 stop:1581 length:1464 start_codon:yes stop_codon:yes gene_type:complete